MVAVKVIVWQILSYWTPKALQVKEEASLLCCLCRIGQEGKGERDTDGY